MPLEPSYFLNSSRLAFRIWTMEDVPFAHALWGNPEVTRTIGGPFSDSQILERLAREIANQLAHKLQYWPIFLRESGEFVGCCGLHPYDLEREMFELGYYLNPPFWRKGLATEAAQAAIDYAFDTAGLTRIFAGHDRGNLNSKHILEKLGFLYLQDEIYPPTGLLDPLYSLSHDSRRE